MFTEAERSNMYYYMLEHDHIEQENQQKIVNDFFTELLASAKKEFRYLCVLAKTNLEIESRVKEHVINKAGSIALNNPIIRNELLDFTLKVKISHEYKLLLDYKLGESLKALHGGYSPKRTLRLSPEEIEKLWVSKHGNKVLW